MADNAKYLQTQAYTLAGSGCTLAATSITLTNMLQIDGVTLVTMADFGSKGFATIEPGNGTQEEQISFTGITQNSNGTATLTGVHNVLFSTPYTETSGTALSHAGGTTFVISNTSGFYARLQGDAIGTYTNGTTTKNAADSSATQTIAHGLGSAPSKVKLTATAIITATSSSTATTTYNGTTQSSVSVVSTGSSTIGIDTTFTLNADNATTGTQTGVMTFDATNITITWTKTGSPTGTYTILWEAQD